MNAHFWLTLAVAALWIVGVWTLFLPGMLLQPFGDWASYFLGKMAVKPLFACPMCMASVHGSLAWWFCGGVLLWWVPFVLCLCGTMKILTILILNED